MRAGKPEHVSSDPDGTRVEFSIGPGAHTHYWDHTAEAIAEVLDRLIATARAATPPVRRDAAGA